MIYEFSKISKLTLDSLDRQLTAFIFPIGGLEDFGPHLPLGFSLQKSQSVCQLIADEISSQLPNWNMVLMPAAPLSIDTNTRQLALRMRSYVLRDWLIDQCRSLRRSGFTQYICYSSDLGPRQLTAIEEAGKTLGRFKKMKFISLSSALVNSRDVKRSPFFPNPVEHGGKVDTSIALALFPKQVNPIYTALPKRENEGLASYLSGRRQSYWGSPSQASAEHGQEHIKKEIQSLVPKVIRVLQGGNPRSDFRSWYSLLPPNGSFFKAWFLFLMILALVLFWVYLALGVFGLPIF